MLIFLVQRHIDPAPFPSRFGSADGGPWTTDTRRTPEPSEVTLALPPYARQGWSRDVRGAMAGTPDGGKLAHNQEMCGTHGLLRERHSHKNPRRSVARRESMAKGPRRQSLDQC